MNKKDLNSLVNRNLKLVEIQRDLRTLSSFALKQIKLICDDELEIRENVVKIQNQK